MAGCIAVVVEVVPMLGTVLSRMIPMLGACKHENMQWVFAYGEFSVTWCT